MSFFRPGPLTIFDVQDDFLGQAAKNWWRFVPSSTLWWTNIAMENGHFSWKIHYKSPFSIAMLVHHPVIKHGTSNSPSKNLWGLSSWLVARGFFNRSVMGRWGYLKKRMNICHYCNRNDATIILESILIKVPNIGEVSNNHLWWLWWQQFQKVA